MIALAGNLLTKYTLLLALNYFRQGIDQTNSQAL